ncbi:hypothetical protein ACFXA8_12635, partial [Streptomyces sp. NPDC059409]
RARPRARSLSHPLPPAVARAGAAGAAVGEAPPATRGHGRTAHRQDRGHRTAAGGGAEDGGAGGGIAAGSGPIPARPPDTDHPDALHPDRAERAGHGLRSSTDRSRR